MSSVYAATVLAEAGLVSYWRLGEPSGTTAADSKGTNAGTYKNGPTLGASGPILGDPNTAVGLNGTNQYIEVPDSASLDVGDTFSLELWVKRSAAGNTDCLITKHANAFKLQFIAEDKFKLRRPGVSDILTSTAKVSDTTSWHHIVATKSGATAKLYLDSTDVSGTVTNSTMTNNAEVLALGAEHEGAEPVEGALHGSLDEIAIYNVTLSAAQVLDHYQKGVSIWASLALLGAGR